MTKDVEKVIKKSIWEIASKALWLDDQGIISRVRKPYLMNDVC